MIDINATSCNVSSNHVAKYSALDPPHDTLSLTLAETSTQRFGNEAVLAKIFSDNLCLISSITENNGTAWAFFFKQVKQLTRLREVWQHMEDSIINTVYREHIT